MHPSEAALIGMSTEELETYRADVRERWLETDEPINGPYRTRVDLIDAILADRKRSAGLEGER